ncbi:MAG: phospho-N-acetylmuramoyl-pentapeptide-transferase [Planctomycetota bacterium]|jgi:phospho-N-acetylmuramoyl-pentapeptide-transferase
MLYRMLIGAASGAAGPALPHPGLRALLAGATALLACLALGRVGIAWLRRLKVQEKTEKTPIEDEVLRRRIAAKSGTPTMGGVMVLAALVASCMAWADAGNPLVWVTLLCALALGALGAVDDRRKLRGARPTDRGLKARYKLAAQALVGAAVGLLILRHAGGAGAVAYRAPLLPGAGLMGALLFAAWAAFMVGTMSNATNVTDGMDGLLAGLTPLAAIVLGGACWAVGSPAACARLGLQYVPGAGELSVFCGALSGACLGFLWYNRHPARVFMGDTGALAIGGGLAAAALAARQELLLIMVGLVFLVEFGSSLLQIGYFKVRGRRILPVAPVHIILEKRGDPEPLIVQRFYLCGAAAALIGLNVLWL